MQQYVFSLFDHAQTVDNKSSTIIFQAPSLKEERVWDQGCLPLSLTLALDKFTLHVHLNLFCFVRSHMQSNEVPKFWFKSSLSWIIPQTNEQL